MNNPILEDDVEKRLVIGDDGTLDTVVHYRGETFRYSSEYRFTFHSDKDFLANIKEELDEELDEEQKRRTETLIRLAELAVPQNEDWGSERQINAEINWVETASKNMTSERVEEWNTYALKATTEEAVNYGLKLLGINYTV